MQIYLYLFIIGGLALAAIFDFSGIQSERWYWLMVAVLLAIGLYSSTFGIHIGEARRHWRLILQAVTVGVLVKALIIGTVMTLLLKHPFGFILGIIVAQIDPLATAVLMKPKRMSKGAQSILRAWSSFDDPMTVILSLYAPILVAFLTGAEWQPIRDSMQAAGLQGYFMETAVNLLFAGGVFVLWQAMKRYSKSTNYIAVLLVAFGIYGLLVGALSVAVYYFWMLGIAFMGLFMRPPIQRAIDHGLHWALSLAAILLGILLINGIAVWKGVALGLAAYGAQIGAGFLLTRKLPARDRWHIAFAQQNGITAVILALLFESYYPGTVAIVAPAIITVNMVHVLANGLLDAYLAKDFQKLAPVYHMKRLHEHIRKI